MKDPFKPSVAGVGFRGKGQYTSNHKEALKFWNNMLTRCYRVKSGAEVCKEWHNFQNFAKWFYDNHREGYHLDKDLLSEGNKVYSPLTCVFLPPRINYVLNSKRRTKRKLLSGVTHRKSCGKNPYESSHRDEENNKVFLGNFPTEKEAFTAYKVAREKTVKTLAKDHFASGLIEKPVYNTLMRFTITEDD